MPTLPVSPGYIDRYKQRPFNQDRISEGIPACIGAYFSETIPTAFCGPEKIFTMGFQEVPTSFYSGIQQNNVFSVIVTDITTKNKHVKFPTNRVAGLVRSGSPKDYLQYFSGKNPALRPLFTFGVDFLNSKRFDEELAHLQNQLTGNFFVCFHQGDIGRKLTKLSRIPPIKIWSATFEDTIYERNYDKEFRILHNRDLELAKYMYKDGCTELRQAARAKAKKELDANTKFVPFTISCFYLPGNYMRSDTPVHFSLSHLQESNSADWEKAARECKLKMDKFVESLSIEAKLRNLNAAIDELAEKRQYVLDLGRTPMCPKDWNTNLVELNNALKVKKGNITSAFLKLDDATLKWFNSAEGRPTGIESALLSRPNLLGRGINEASNVLNALGYEVSVSKDVIKRLERKRQFYALQETPLHELQGHELLAYYNHGKYKAKTTITNPDNGKVIWEKNKEYEVIPTWDKTEYEGGSEPLVDETNSIIGMENLSVRLSFLTIKVQTEDASISVAENQTREELAKAPPAKKGKPVWTPLLDEFIEAFGLPKVPTVMDIRPELLKTYYKKLKVAMPDLKKYQVDCAIRNATKRGGIIAGTMGSGKTRMAIAILLLRDHMFNLVVVPTMLVDSWLEHFKMYNLHAQPLLSHNAITELNTRYLSLKGLKPDEKRKKLHANQEFYVTTAEFLTLGGIGNAVYDEWTAIYEQKRPIVDPITGEIVTDHNGRKAYEVLKQELKSTRYQCKKEHKEAKLEYGTRHNFWDHIKECPTCKEKDLFTSKGYCGKCKTAHYSYKGNNQRTATCLEGHANDMRSWILKGGCPSCDAKEVVSVSSQKEEVIDIGFINQLLEGTSGEKTTAQKVKSVKAYPAYKRLSGIFGAKAIDEVHLLANFNSQRGMAIFGIKTKESWVASGTIARGYVTDLEASLCHVHGANTPIFPFYPWDQGRQGFREQFVTERVKTVITDGKTKKMASSPMPEASNLNRLRRMLNCVTTTVPESLMEKEWKLPPITRIYEEIALNPENQERYLQELTQISSWFSGATSVERHRGALQRLWNLRVICDGIEKEAMIDKYIKQWKAEGRKFVLTASTKNQYKRLCAVLNANKIKYLAVDEKTPADERDLFTSQFSDPKIQALVSRTKLVNVGLNTMVHADRLLISSLEYAPDILRQMEKRLCRPGQKSKDVIVVYPVVRMKPRSSVEEKMLKLLLEKEIAVKEMTQGKVRWQSAAQLLEAAREKKGAAKVLQDIMDHDVTSEAESADIDNLFKEKIVITSEELNHDIQNPTDIIIDSEESVIATATKTQEAIDKQPELFEVETITKDKVRRTRLLKVDRSPTQKQLEMVLDTL